VTADTSPIPPPHIDDVVPSRTRVRLVAIVAQLGQLAAVLVAVSVLTFLLLNALPGSVVDARIGPLPNFSPEQRAELTETLSRQLGLDKPLWYQYAVWVRNAATGDFGLTYQGLETGQVIADRLPATLQLSVVAIVLGVVLALAASILAYRTRFRPLRGAIQFSTTVLLVIPPFWLGLLLVIPLAALLNWLPSAGYVPARDDPVQNLKFLLLPAVTLALPQMALFFRYLYAGLEDATSMAFVTAAHARGLRERAVVYGHVLPNAVLPTITVVGLVVGSMISGLVIVESVFSWPGLGLLLVDSVRVKDYNTVAAIVLLTAVTYVVVAFIVDVLYQLLDPRTRRPA
jgi:peptide/nickel transport system permease protein